MKTNRELFIEKFERNFNLVEEFKTIYEAHIIKTNSWDLQAFPDDASTNGEYLTTLKQISTLEYSKEQHEAIKTVPIPEEALPGYMHNLDLQYESLKLLYEIILAKA